MAEKVVSPGVFTNEIDQSFLPAAIGDIGAAVIGPTVKGPALVPTVVSSYSEYQQLFGDTFKSGSNYYSYLTSVTAQNYLRHGNKLTVVRILDNQATVSEASASVTNDVTATAAGVASASLVIANAGPPTGEEVTINGVDFMFVSGSVSEVAAAYSNTSTQKYVSSGSSQLISMNNLSASKETLKVELRKFGGGLTANTEPSQKKFWKV